MAEQAHPQTSQTSRAQAQAATGIEYHEVLGPDGAPYFDNRPESPRQQSTEIPTAQVLSGNASYSTSPAVDLELNASLAYRTPPVPYGFSWGLSIPPTLGGNAEPHGAEEDPQWSPTTAAPAQDTLTTDTSADMGFVVEGSGLHSSDPPTPPSTSSSMCVEVDKYEETLALSYMQSDILNKAEFRWCSETPPEPLGTADSRRAARRAKKICTIAYADKAHRDYRPRFQDVESYDPTRPQDAWSSDQGGIGDCGQGGSYNGAVVMSGYPSELVELEEPIG